MRVASTAETLLPSILTPGAISDAVEVVVAAAATAAEEEEVEMEAAEDAVRVAEVESVVGVDGK
jgi:hypothetical protein